ASADDHRSHTPLSPPTLHDAPPIYRDLAHTYSLIARQGTDAFYHGPLAEEIASTVQDPPVTEDTDLPVPPGSMTASDIAGYEVRSEEHTSELQSRFDVVCRPLLAQE